MSDQWSRGLPPREGWYMVRDAVDGEETTPRWLTPVRFTDLTGSHEFVTWGWDPTDDPEAIAISFDEANFEWRACTPEEELEAWRDAMIPPHIVKPEWVRRQRDVERLASLARGERPCGLCDGNGMEGTSDCCACGGSGISGL